MQKITPAAESHRIYPGYVKRDLFFSELDQQQNRCSIKRDKPSNPLSLLCCYRQLFL